MGSASYSYTLSYTPPAEDGEARRETYIDLLYHIERIGFFFLLGCIAWRLVGFFEEWELVLLLLLGTCWGNYIL